MHKIQDASVSMPIFTYPAAEQPLHRHSKPEVAFKDYPKQKVSIFQEQQSMILAACTSQPFIKS
jgi:hypothetical protein